MKYYVWCPMRGDDVDHAQEKEAYDAADAAEQYVAIRECRLLDFSVADGKMDMIVLVRDPYGKVGEYVVTGRHIPQYRARLLCWRS